MRLAPFLIFVILGTLASLRTESVVAAPPVTQRGEGFGPWHPLEVLAAPGLPPARLSAPQLPPATSDIVITFIDVPVGMRPAIEHAAAIWEAQITSPVKIRGTVSWVTVEGAFLARTRAAHHLQDPVEDPKLALPGVLYPAALAHTIRGFRSNEGADFEIELNALVSDWYGGQDGQPPANQYDLVTVALHEMAHGLGVDSGIGLINGVPVLSPTAFDTLLTVRDGSKLHTRPRPALLALLTGDEILVGGPSVIIAAGGTAPRVHAPPRWEAGSSIGHFHAFHSGTDDDALMVAALFPGWAFHDPGPMLLATLKDVGWTISRLGQGTRLRVVTAMPSFVEDDMALFPIRVEVQDPVGVFVLSSPGVSVDLEAFGESTSSEGLWDCLGSRRHATAGGKATFERCIFDDTGYAAIFAFADGLMPGSTHQFRIADITTARAPAVARSP